ncbi:hypothetical protein RIF23_09610 [Lipingzhangella sp. LS1_29]|uniref:Uncharacterized protein n=1 Tax=Lipingzhangella rawalii TaxID=2055835 RepID=A0ABU2H5G5_9ACTN|nr:hypothetical protein [Lipingzhangella rawalii]MDS1270552.1 hypothetical protein [Lipingzhangella rawalii]
MSFAGAASAPNRSDEYERLCLYVEGMTDRAARAVPWDPETVGIPTEEAREDSLLRVNDLAFYANARNEVSVLAELCRGLLSLHRPRDGGGISSDPSGLVRRCGCCMLRWPCPTIREMSRLLR